MSEIIAVINWSFACMPFGVKENVKFFCRSRIGNSPDAHNRFNDVGTFVELVLEQFLMEVIKE